jgi:phosphate/sulfate permease
MMGILGWIFLPVVGGIIAIITGHLAKKEIRQSDGLLGGDGLATAGLVLGYANLVLGLCGCLFLFAGLWAFGYQIFNTFP